MRNALARPLVDALRERARMLDCAGRLAPAAVGRGREQRAGVRGDRIGWLATPYSREESAFVAWLDEIRIACNRELFLGLEDFEGHYAIYPPGARYERHRDRFRDDDARVLSCVLYLNDAWNSRDGGALRLYTPDALDVLPEGGTFVAFLAADFDHEVLPASRERIALTGWFRRRALVAA